MGLVKGTCVPGVPTDNGGVGGGGVKLRRECEKCAGATKGKSGWICLGRTDDASQLFLGYGISNR
jgi:hypothetical protein